MAVMAEVACPCDVATFSVVYFDRGLAPDPLGQDTASRRPFAVWPERQEDIEKGG